LTLEYKKTDRELSYLEYSKFKIGKWDPKKDELKSRHLKIKMQQLEEKLKKLKIPTKAHRPM